MDAPHWTPHIVQHAIEDWFDMEHPKRRVQDLLHEAGCTCKTTRPAYGKGDEPALKAFKEGNNGRIVISTTVLSSSIRLDGD